MKNKEERKQSERGKPSDYDPGLTSMKGEREGKRLREVEPQTELQL